MINLFKNSIDRSAYLNTLQLIKKKEINTICLAANCPNRYHCFAEKTVTFLVLGDICTRNCFYCDVNNGVPLKPDVNELTNILQAINILQLKYVVLTQVSRDDLKDNGATHFANIIKQIKEKNIQVEALISDLQGDEKNLKQIIAAKPDVINHNIEVVQKYFSNLRPQGNYQRSINLLKKIKEIDPNLVTKSGFMVGFGEKWSDILATLKDLKKSQVDIITIGQYHQPNPEKQKVVKYYREDEFIKIKQAALELGFSQVEAGIFVRSSYRAKESLNEQKMAIDSLNRN